MPAGFHGLAAALDRPLGLFDRDGRLLACNAPMRAVLKLDIGGPLHSVLQSSELELRRFLAQARRSRQPIPGRLQLRGGGELSCEASLLPQPDVRTSPTLLQVDPADRTAERFNVLTERLRAMEEQDAVNRHTQSALSVARAQLASLLEHSPHAISVKDARGRYTLVDPSFCALIGRARVDVLDALDGDLLPPERAQQMQSVDAEVMAGATPQSEETWTVGESERVLLVDAFPIDNPLAGRSVGRVYTDVTDVRAADAERAELQVRLLDAQKLESLGVLAGGIAHDFNNLLMGVLGNVSLAVESVESAPAQSVACLGEIRTSARRAAALCRQLLGYAGKGKLNVRSVDVSSVAAESVRLLALSPNARVEVDLDPSRPCVMADTTQLQQVFMNLVSNAGEALGARPGRVSVSSRAMRLSESELFGLELEPGNYVVVEVADSGVGMDTEVLGRIFEPFFTTKFTGRGLGLAAVQGIVRSHRGGIRVSSTPGAGSRFEVVLPTTRRPPALPSLPPPPPEQLRRLNKTVLVIDDDPLVRRVARRLLRRLGYKVVEAEDGFAGLALFEPARFAVVLLDLTMPGMGGLEVLARLEVIDPEVRVVLSSGYTQDEVTSALEERPQMGFLQKPYGMPELADVLAAVAVGDPPHEGS